MYKDLKSFKNYASVYTKRPFISFREIIYENSFNCFIVLYLDFLHLFFHCFPHRLVKIDS